MAVRILSGMYGLILQLQVRKSRGFATTGGKAIDFLIVDKNAAIQYQKHTVSKIITPEQNQTADAWKFGYRTVGIAEAKDNKKVAIYVHKAGE